VARCTQREHDPYDARPPTIDGLIAALGQPRLGIVQIDRGTAGFIPYAAVGSGRPVVVLAGLSPGVGVAGDGFVRGVLAPVRGWPSGVA
jgi:hypothetical protein